MKKLNDLRQQRAKLHDRNKTIMEIFNTAEDERTGKLTDEQLNAEYEENEGKVAQLTKEIEVLEKWEDRQSQLTMREAALADSAGTVAPVHGEPAGPVSGADERTAPVAHGYHQERSSQNWQIEAQRQYRGGMRFIQGERMGMRAEERAYRTGMWGLMIASKTLPTRYHFPKAIKFCQEQGLIVHGEGASDTTGAHVTVPDEFSADLINLKESRGVVRRIFGRVAMMRETLTVPRRTSGLTAYAVGENSAGTESDMGLDDIELVARKWMVLTRMSKELDEDNAVAFGDVLAGEIAYAFADKEDEAGFNGDGTSTYHSIIGARTRLQDVDGAGTDSAGLVTGAGNAYSELTLANFESVVGTLPQYADTNDTVWVTSRTVYFTVMKRLELASGGVTSMEISDGAMARRPRPIFLGYPVEISQVMPSTEANSQVCALLGDFGMGAKFGDRRGDTIEFDDTVNVGGQSVWERDQIAAKGTTRWDINVHEFGDSSNAGAIVGLETAAA